jgi:hypothetical protein
VEKENLEKRNVGVCEEKGEYINDSTRTAEAEDAGIEVSRLTIWLNDEYTSYDELELSLV